MFWTENCTCKPTPIYYIFKAPENEEGDQDFYIIVSNSVFLWILFLCVCFWCFVFFCLGFVVFFFNSGFFFICLFSKEREGIKLDGWGEEDLRGTSDQENIVWIFNKKRQTVYLIFHNLLVMTPKFVQY